MTVTRGLEGIVATTSSVSSIIDDTLTYAGYNIDDLAVNATFEEVVYLLWHRRLPNAAELQDLTVQLANNMEIPNEIIEHFKMYDIKNVHPMAALRTAISFLGLFDKDAEVMEATSNYDKAIRLQAKIPTIVTAFARIRKGLDPVPPRKDIRFAANFLYM